MTDQERLTINLTGRRPVSIVKADWPVIAEVEHEDFEGEYRMQANRITDFMIKVRRHVDGRAIVYGKHSFETRWASERGGTFRRGELLDRDDDICHAIKRVCEDLEEASGNPVWSRMVNDCINDMPAVEI